MFSDEMSQRCNIHNMVCVDCSSCIPVWNNTTMSYHVIQVMRWQPIDLTVKDWRTHMPHFPPCCLNTDNQEAKHSDAAWETSKKSCGFFIGILREGLFPMKRCTYYEHIQYITYTPRQPPLYSYLKWYSLSLSCTFVSKSKKRTWRIFSALLHCSLIITWFQTYRTIQDAEAPFICVHTRREVQVHGVPGESFHM